MSMSPLERAEMLKNALTEARALLVTLANVPEKVGAMKRLEELELRFSSWTADPPTRTRLKSANMTNDVLGLLLTATRLRRTHGRAPSGAPPAR